MTEPRRSRSWAWSVLAAIVVAVPFAVGPSRHVDASTNIATWGVEFGVTPPEGDGYVQVAAGFRHSLALRSDGSIHGWADEPWGNEYGQADPPAGTGFQAIAAAGNWSLSLAADGSLVAWGSNLSGETSPPSGSGYTAIAAGGGHGLALTAEGAIVGWGSNDYGQADPPAGTGYQAVAAGSFHSVALAADGSIVAWGWNLRGQTDPPGGTGYTDVAAGGDSGLALNSDGEIVAWGWDEADLLEPPSGNGFVQIAISIHALALRADGSIVGWGRDQYGQASPPSGNGFTAIAVGPDYSVALTAGVLSAPMSVTALAGHGDATVSWHAPLSDAGSTVTSYEVVSAPDARSCTTSGLSCTLEDLTNGTEYTFRVRAINAIGPGPWSAPSAPVTPTADPYGEFTPLTPARLLDTRTGNGRGGVVGPLGQEQSFDVQVTGRGGVAVSGVSAVVMNVTVTQPTQASHLIVWPTGSSRPDTSNLNYVPGQTVPNLVTVAIGASGQVSVFNQFGSTHVIMDVVGFYADDPGPAGSRFHSLAPERIIDTRHNIGGVGTSPLGTTPLEFNVVGRAGVPGSGVTAVVMNVTVALATQPSHLTVYPGDVGLPNASNLNYVANLTVPNLVVVRVPANGVIRFHNAFGTVHVIADVVGYYDGDKSTEAGRFIAFDPFRFYDSRDYDEAWGPDETWLVGSFPGFAGIPLGEADSVLLNVTAAGPSEASHLTVFPSDNCYVPNASNLNFTAGRNVPNQVIVRLGPTDGCAGADDVETIAIYNLAGWVHVIVDLFGMFTSPTTTLF